MRQQLFAAVRPVATAYFQAWGVMATVWLPGRRGTAVRRRVMEVLKRFEWGPKFWLFCLRYLLWPPYTWNVSGRMIDGQGRPVSRWLRWGKPILDYLHVAAAITILIMAVLLFMGPYWYAGLIIVVLFPLKLFIIALRVQMTYQWGVKAHGRDSRD